MSIQEYLEDAYVKFEKDESMHLSNCKWFSQSLARYLNDLILSSGNLNKHHVIDSMRYKIVNKVNGENQSNKLSYFDYSKIPSYFQIVFPDNKTCARFFVSPHVDGNVFYGFYEDYDSEKDNKLSQSTIAVEEAYMSLESFNNSAIIIRIIDFLLYKKINQSQKQSSIVFH